MPLQGFRTSQGDPCPMPIRGQAVGRRDPVGNSKERYWNMGAEWGNIWCVHLAGGPINGRQIRECLA